MTRALLATILVLAGCGARPRVLAHEARGGVEVTLYRDHAVVAHRLAVEIPAASTATVRLKVAAGIEPEAIYIVEESPVKIREARLVGGAPPAEPEPIDEPPPPEEESPLLDEPSIDEELEMSEPVPEPPPPPDLPREIELVLGAPSEGTYRVLVGYDTNRIGWEAAYTLTTTAARDRAVLGGAIAIRNATGVALRDATVWIVDAEHGPYAARLVERRGDVAVGSDGQRTTEVEPRRVSGLAGARVDLVEGDTRIELLGRPRERRMRSVLVYDPIGNKLDHPGTNPVREATLGVRPAPSPRVHESFEIERDAAATAGLPAGRVRLLERRADGGLALLGEARLFEASTRSATVDTIPIGAAEGVIGRRERRELAIDDQRKRIVEEFAITIESTRALPVDVVVREHFYRSQNWTLAYISIPVTEVTKEGAQQVAVRLRVPPARGSRPGQVKVLYVVVYTW